jgi:hypothetical protein
MYVYLLWDHGRQSLLAWNSILLPAEHQFDVGAESENDLPNVVPVPTSGRKRGRRVATPTQDDTLLAHSLELLAKIHQSAPSSQSTTILSTGPAPANHVATTQEVSNLSVQADILMAKLVELEKVPQMLEGLKPLLIKSLEAIINKMCKLTSEGHDSLVDQDMD